jgi:methionine sulfoxide reductase catalytic subunit
VGEDAVDVTKWFPESYGIPPHVRVGRNRWFNLLWLLPIGFVVLISAVAVAQGLRTIPSVEDFIARYPGTIVSAEAHENPGFPVWVGVQHFFNLFLMIFILRSGLQILSDHPRLYWTRHSTPGKDWFRFQKEVPTEGSWTAKQDSVSLPGQIGLPGLRHSIGLARRWHLGVDTLWLLNGVVFYVLLFATGHWRRVVPTSWDVLPNALSVQISRTSSPSSSPPPRRSSPGWGCRPRCRRVSSGSVACSASRPRDPPFPRVYLVLDVHRDARPLRVHDRSAREPQPHLWVRDDDSWIGLTVFALSMVVLIVGWVAATPLTLRHPRVVQRVGFALIGPVQRLFEHVDSTAGHYTERDISPYFWRNGKLPDSEKYAALLATNFVGCRVSLSGAACRCRRSSTSFARSSRPSGSCFTHLLTVRMGASITTCTRSSRCATR